MIINNVLNNNYKLDEITGNFATDHHMAIQEIYKKIRSGEIATTDGATRYFYNLLFNKRKYDLTPTGRFKFNQKLNILNRIKDHCLAEDIKGQR